MLGAIVLFGLLAMVPGLLAGAVVHALLTWGWLA